MSQTASTGTVYNSAAGEPEQPVMRFMPENIIAVIVLGFDPCQPGYGYAYDGPTIAGLTILSSNPVISKPVRTMHQESERKEEQILK